MTNSPITKEGLRINYTLKNSIEAIVKGVSTNINTDAMLNSSKLGNTALKVTKHNFDGRKYLHVKVESPEEGKPLETLFICVIDISGSMGSDASIEESKGESHGFSRLDLVKHSLKTVVNSVNDDDYISLITFSETASVIQEPLQMISTNKSSTCDKVDALMPTNSTNIWDALRLGMEVSNNPAYIDKNISILLFTDGVPNINPPRGIINSLERF